MRRKQKPTTLTRERSVFMQVIPKTFGYCFVLTSGITKWIFALGEVPLALAFEPVEKTKVFGSSL